ncbi:MAG: hypothetical protein KAW16_07330 [candidate division Zixibacteria bacterium]|nr:hypothetical protein [candidate division Zixibacteria bacterium]
MDATNLKIKRVIVEVRYSGVLSYSRLREELFDRWVRDFTRIEVSDSSIEIIDTSRSFKIFSAWDRSGLYFENVEDPNDYIKKTNEYLRKLLDHYNRTELSRIGNRFEFILPYEGPFEELFKTLKNNIYKEKIDELGEIVDLGTFVLTAKEGEKKIRISLGPVRKYEITRKNEFGFEGDPDVAFLLDIDYYSDIKKQYDIATFIENAWKFADKRSKQFIKSIS